MRVAMGTINNASTDEHVVKRTLRRHINTSNGTEEFFANSNSLELTITNPISSWSVSITAGFQWGVVQLREALRAPITRQLSVQTLKSIRGQSTRFIVESEAVPEPSCWGDNGKTVKEILSKLPKAQLNLIICSDRCKACRFEMHREACYQFHTCLLQHDWDPESACSSSVRTAASTRADVAGDLNYRADGQSDEEDCDDDMDRLAVRTSLAEGKNTASEAPIDMSPPSP